VEKLSEKLCGNAGCLIKVQTRPPAKCGKIPKTNWRRLLWVQFFFRTEHIFLPCGARKNNFHLRAISLVRFAHFATLSPADLARKWADKSSREKNIQSLVFVFFGLFFWGNYSKTQRNINGFCLQYRLTTWTVFVDLIYGLRICVSFFASRIHFQLGSVLIKLCHATLI